MYEPKEYQKTYTIQSGKSVGELGSPTQAKEAWFSERHTIVRHLPEFPKSRDSTLGSKLNVRFPYVVCLVSG